MSLVSISHSLRASSRMSLSRSDFVNARVTSAFVGTARPRSLTCESSTPRAWQERPTNHAHAAAQPTARNSSPARRNGAQTHSGIDDSALWERLEAVAHTIGEVEDDMRLAGLTVDDAEPTNPVKGLVRRMTPAPPQTEEK